MDYVAGFPNSSLMTYEQACERRDCLMAERQAIQRVGGDDYYQFFSRQFSLCEH